MEKVKIIKKLPKGKIPKEMPSKTKSAPRQTNHFADKYLEFYDDIKVPSRKYHW